MIKNAFYLSNIQIVVLFISIFSENSANDNRVFEVSVGKEVELKCNITDSRPSTGVFWKHIAVGALLTRTVSLNEIVFEKFKGRFIAVKREDIYNLKITNISLNDSGKYTCAIGEKFQTSELVVFEKYPSPQYCTSNSSTISYIGKNSCEIEPEDVILECSLIYKGNLNATLDWKVADSSQAIEATVAESTSTLKLKADKINSTAITCSVKYAYVSIKSSFNWTQQVVINTLMEEKKIHNLNCSANQINCSSNTTIQCNCTWKKQGGGYYGSGPVLSFQPLSAGIYVCSAICPVSSRNCNFTRMTVNYTCDHSEVIELGSSGMIIGVAVGSMLVITLVVTAGVLYFRIFRRRQNQEGPNYNLQRQSLREGETTETADVGESESTTVTPKSSSWRPRRLPWVTQTAEGAKASGWRNNQSIMKT